MNPINYATLKQAKRMKELGGKTIVLSRGMVAIVDTDDYDKLNGVKWTAHWNGRQWYAVRVVGTRKDHKTIRMHRYILNAKEGEYVDHRDGDGLNNQKNNLRLCNKSQNAMNRGKQRDNTSGYKGVSPSRGIWTASIKINNRTINLGRFSNKETAARIYDNAAKKYHGKFANLNFRETL